MNNTNVRHWLEKFDAFNLKGKEAKRFINGITTSNLVENTNSIIKTCWLTPTGNLRSLLEIHCEIDEANQFLIIVLQGKIEEIKEYCEDMIFPSDDVTVGEIFTTFRLQEVDELYSWRNFTPKILSKYNQKDYCLNNRLNILDYYEQQIWKITQAIPTFDNEIDGKNNPLELGLTDLIDFNKGCYLGQETMAKLKKVSSLKHEIRVWSNKKTVKQIELKNNKIFFDQNKKKIVGYITSLKESKSQIIFGLGMIKKNFLNKYESFYSEELGTIKINKSVGSVFL